MDNVRLTLDICSILAIVTGPIIALELQRRLDAGREAKTRKLWIFRTLMSYRATRIAPAFVQALNLIDLDFDGKSKAERQVRTAWKVLLDQLSSAETAKEDDKVATLTADLLIAMSKSLGYEFDPVQIKKGVYHPIGLVNMEQESHDLRRKVLDLLSGGRRLPVAVFEDKFPPITMPSGEKSV
jgi:hypothetical protein